VSEIHGPLAADLDLNLDSGDHLGDIDPTPGRSRIAARIRWALYLLIAGICIYRIWVFRPIPLDDGPGALRPLLYGWFTRGLALFATPNDAFSTWSQCCLAALLFITFLAILNFVWREDLIRIPTGVGRVLCSPVLFWSLLAVTLVFCRLPILLKGELNPDESQFLASAEKLFYDLNFFRSVDCGTSGPVNIYPLMLPAIFGFSPDLASSRLIGVIAVFLSIYWLYRAVKLVSNERLARLSILPVAGTFAMFRHGELVHYSSEHIPFLLVSLAIYQGAKVITDAHRQLTPNLFWIGFLASAAYFTKMQAVPIIVSIGVVSFACIWFSGYRLRVWHSACLGIAGALVPILCVLASCLEGGVFRDFWRTYVRANMLYANAANGDGTLKGFAEYVSALPEVRVYLFAVFAIVVAHLISKKREAGNGSQSSFAELLVLSAAISASALLSSAERSSVYAYLAILCICAAPVYFLFQLQERTVRQDPVKWFGLLAVLSTAVAAYCVYKPHRYFFHYLLFLYIPLGAVVGYLLSGDTRTEDGQLPSQSGRIFRSRRKGDGRVAFLGTALVLTLSCQIYLWSFQNPTDFNLPAGLAAPEGNLIRYLTAPHSKIFVWGWALNPYFSSGRVSAARDTNVMTSFQSYRGIPPVYTPTPQTERLSSIYRKRMLRDLQADPPALFIDAIGPTSWFIQQREYWGFELVPSIKDFVERRYVHLIDIYGQRYFMRRDLAAKREAEFSRPLLNVACEATALRCYDHPITLPTELPPTNIPQHARIDITFTPIHNQLGPATVFNSEKTPSSYRGLRLQYVEKNRYVLLIGVGDRWVISKSFSKPQGSTAFASIELDGTDAKLKEDGRLIDDIHLPHPFVDSGGPLNLGSWISGVDPFSGTVQFVQILDLNRKQNKNIGRAS
jgi:hypothetical protein